MENKQKFYSLLEDIYLGEIANKIEGKSGFTNIMKIKSEYFKDIKPMIEDKLKEYFKNNDDINEASGKLLDFFSNYINETGTPFFKDTKIYDNRYVKLYNNKDTELFWKTKDLYYVKSEIVHESLNNLEIDNYIFNFDATKIKHLKNNEKKILGYDLKSIDIKNKKINITLSIFYEPSNSKKGKIDNILNIINNKLKIMELKLLDKKILEKFIKIYKKKNEIDYFIHKDAKKFLSEQLHMYVYNYMFDNNELDNQYSNDRIIFIQNFKKIALEIINYIARFENELKSMWEKPKFVKEVNYVITLDRININTLKIILNSDLTKQIQEWKDFKFVEKDFNINQIIENNNLNKLFEKLPLDTKYLIKEMKYKLLESINNLDEKCDGVLIHSDNWQALNTITPKYEGQIDLCYIDPPFNTGSDFIYKDKFQDSTWLTLMDNRLKLIKKMFNLNYSFYYHIDGNANHLSKLLLNYYFNKEESNIIWSYKSGGMPDNQYAKKHDNILYYQNGHKILISHYINKKFIGMIIDYSIKNNLKLNIKKFLFMNYQNIINNYSFILEDMLKNNVLLKDEKGYKIKHSGKNFEYMAKKVTDVWDDITIINNQSLERVQFDTQKPEALLKRIINNTQINKNKNKKIILDYFNGSGTTINTAHKLGNKWIGIEIGNHFYEKFIDNKGKKIQGNLQRLKKTLNGFQAGITKEVNWQGGGFFKYYELEQYEETLSKADYTKKENQKLDVSLIDFSLSEKLLKDVLIEDLDNNDVYIDFTKLYSTIDTAEIAETLSNVSGMKIKLIKEKEIIFIDSYSNKDIILNTEKISLYNSQFKNYFKSLLYWNNDKEGDLL